MCQRMAIRIFQLSFISIFLLAMGVFLPLNGMAGWRLTPQFSLAEIYTDNVELAASGLEDEEFITQISPGVSLIGIGAKSEINLEYRMDGFLYVNEGNRNTVNHQMAFDVSHIIGDEHVFIDANGAYTQNIINVQDAVSAESFFITENRTDTAVLNVSSYLRGRFGEGINSEVRASYGLVDYQDVSGLDSRVEQISAFLDGREVPGRIGWLTGYGRRVTIYENRPDATFESIEGELDIKFTGRLSLLGIVGQESNTYEQTDPELDSEDSFWRTGFRWRPSHRTSLEVTSGERFFGETYSLRLDHRARYVEWDIEYVEDLQTTGLEQLDRLSTEDDGANEALPGEVASLTNEVFILKRWSGSISRTKGKSDINIRFFRDRRYFQERQTWELSSVANISWVWQFAPQTRSMVRYSKSRNQFFDVGREDEVSIYNFSLIRNFGRSITISASYRHDYRLSTAQESEYRSNTLTLQLNAIF